MPFRKFGTIGSIRRRFLREKLWRNAELLWPFWLLICSTDRPRTPVRGCEVDHFFFNASPFKCSTVPTPTATRQVSFLKPLIKTLERKEERSESASCGTDSSTQRGVMIQFFCRSSTYLFNNTRIVSPAITVASTAFMPDSRSLNVSGSFGLVYGTTMTEPGSGSSIPADLVCTRPLGSST